MFRYTKQSENVITGSSSPGEIVSNMQMDEVRKKIKRLKALAIDFDGTITKSHSHWYEVDLLLPKELFNRQMEIRDTYHKKLGIMTEEESAAYERWHVDSNFEVYCKAELREEHFKTAGKRCTPREKASDLLLLFDRAFVVSFGLNIPIEACIAEHRLSVTRVYSGQVHFNEASPCCEIRDLVTPGDKGRCVERIMETHGFQRSEIMSVGDSWGDRLLFHTDALNVLVFAPNEPEADVMRGRLGAIKKLWEAMPLLVVYDDSFDPLVKIINAERQVR